jgi:hypothetical protein
MCWHTVNDNLTSGFRCGPVIGDNTAWERFVYHAD